MEINKRIKYLEWYLDNRWWTFAINQKEVDDYYNKADELYKLKKLLNNK
jgi:hypothetical protein